MILEGIDLFLYLGYILLFVAGLVAYPILKFLDTLNKLRQGYIKVIRFKDNNQIIEEWKKVRDNTISYGDLIIKLKTGHEYMFFRHNIPYIFLNERFEQMKISKAMEKLEAMQMTTKDVLNAIKFAYHAGKISSLLRFFSNTNLIFILILILLIIVVIANIYVAFQISELSKLVQNIQIAKQIINNTTIATP